MKRSSFGRKILEMVLYLVNRAMSLRQFAVIGEVV